MKKIINRAVLAIIILIASCTLKKIENSAPENFIPADVLLFGEVNMNSFMDIMGDQYVESIEGLINDNGEDEYFQIFKNIISSVNKFYAFSTSEENVLNEYTFSKLNIIMIFDDFPSEKWNTLLEADRSEKRTEKYRGVSYTVIDDNLYLYQKETWALFSTNKEMFFESLNTAAGRKNFFRNSPAAQYYQESSPVEVFLAVPDLTETVAATPSLNSSPFRTARGICGNISSDAGNINISVSFEFENKSAADSVNMLFSLSLGMMQNNPDIPPEMAQQMDLFSRVQIKQKENVLEMFLPINREAINSLFKLYAEQ